MNLKERAIATHAAIAIDKRIEQDRIDTARREGYAALLNEAIGENLFFVPDLNPSVEVTERWRNINHGVQRRIDVYDVVTDGSVDIGVTKQKNASALNYVLITGCAGGCGELVATPLWALYFDADNEDEHFARLVNKLGDALAKAKNAICANCEWSPCPHCGHVR